MVAHHHICDHALTDGWQKYTVQSHGIWEKIRQVFSIDAARSTGVPLNMQFRNPPPGANPPQSYDDPVTVPAADIADNPYWKRDVRRSYPRLSVVGQAQAVGLLTFGSASAPKEGALALGAEGSKQLVAVEKEAEQKGLAAFFEGKGDVAAVLDPNGLPPLPSGLHYKTHERKYTLLANDDQSYPEK